MIVSAAHQHLVFLKRFGFKSRTQSCSFLSISITVVSIGTSISAAGGDSSVRAGTPPEEMELLCGCCSKHAPAAQPGVCENTAELTEELFVLPSVLLYWLWRNQLLKRKVGNVLEWVMFVLCLSDCIHGWFSGSIQLLRSFPCSAWHREPLYSCRQHAADWLLTLEVFHEGINRYFVLMQSFLMLSRARA